MDEWRVVSEDSGIYVREGLRMAVKEDEVVEEGVVGEAREVFLAEVDDGRNEGVDRGNEMGDELTRSDVDILGESRAEMMGVPLGWLKVV